MEQCARDVLGIIMQMLDEKSIVAMMGVNKFFNSFAFEYLDVAPAWSSITTFVHLNWLTEANLTIKSPISQAAEKGSFPSILKLLSHTKPIPLVHQKNAMDVAGRMMRRDIFRFFLVDLCVPSDYSTFLALQKPSKTNIIHEILGDPQEANRMYMIELLLQNSTLPVVDMISYAGHDPAALAVVIKHIKPDEQITKTCLIKESIQHPLAFRALATHGSIPVLKSFAKFTARGGGDRYDKLFDTLTSADCLDILDAPLALDYALARGNFSQVTTLCKHTKTPITEALINKSPSLFLRIKLQLLRGVSEKKDDIVNTLHEKFKDAMTPTLFTI